LATVNALLNEYFVALHSWLCHLFGKF